MKTLKLIQKVLKDNIDNEKVYDIEVKNAHHYILKNGIVSHNSMSFIPQNIQAMGCLIPTEKVVTLEGIKCIGDIKEGDKVLSSDGNYHVIEKTWNFEKPTYSFEFTDDRFLTCSNTHRFLINIDNIEMRALNICSSKSKIVVGENVGESIEHVKLDTGNSSVSFLKAGGGEKEIENAKKEKRTINKDDVKFNIVKMEITGMSKDGCLQLIKCDELCSTGYPIKRINGGSIECFYVASLIQFSTSNCDISVNEIGGSQNSIYDANGNGNFRLTNVVNGGITAYSDSGNISINQLLEVGDFKTNSGNITIKNASKYIKEIRFDFYNECVSDKTLTLVSDLDPDLVYFNFIRNRNKEVNYILDDANVTNGMTRDEFLDAVEALGYQHIVNLLADAYKDYLHACIYIR